MRLATWNIGSALGQDIYKNVEYIVQNIEKNLVDVLCLQEVVTSGDATNFIDELQRRLSFCAYSYTISYIKNRYSLIY